MNSKSAADKVLEIEKIVNHKKVNGSGILFQVKWKDRDVYSWLPLTELGIPCNNMILNYYISQGVSVLDLPALNPERRAKQLFELLGSVSDDVLDKFAKRFENLVLPPSQMDSLMRDLKRFYIDDEAKVPNKDLINELRERVLIEKCIRRREIQIRELQEMEWYINKVSDNRWPIRVQNNRDFGVLPRNFTYVNDYIAGYGVNIPKAPPLEIGCGRDEPSCQPHKCKRTCLCLQLFDSEWAYDEHGLVDHSRGARGIVECNRMCRCDENCLNRVVQKGCQAKLLIFKTATGTGWGVKTLEFLPRGMFIGRYVGKVIPWEEGLLPEGEGRSQYLFDIDFSKECDGHSKYTVDAYEYGNFTRFINHSCNPNLTVYNVWIDSLDKDLHEIAFFTRRNVENGEELSFNYRKLLKELLKECKCGASRCVPITN